MRELASRNHVYQLPGAVSIFLFSFGGPCLTAWQTKQKQTITTLSMETHSRFSNKLLLEWATVATEKSDDGVSNLICVISQMTHHPWRCPAAPALPSAPESRKVAATGRWDVHLRERGFSFSTNLIFRGDHLQGVGDRDRGYRNQT